MSKKLTRHTIVLIEGQPCQLLRSPQKAIGGKWIVFFRTEVGGRPEYTYATDQELAEMQASAK